MRAHVAVLLLAALFTVFSLASPGDAPAAGNGYAVVSTADTLTLPAYTTAISVVASGGDVGYRYLGGRLALSADWSDSGTIDSGGILNDNLTGKRVTQIALYPASGASAEVHIR